jgi:hypothetical protein
MRNPAGELCTKNEGEGWLVLVFSLSLQYLKGMSYVAKQVKEGVSYVKEVETSAVYVDQHFIASSFWFRDISRERNLRRMIQFLDNKSPHSQVKVKA